MEPGGIFDEKTEECENILELLKKRSQINEADDKIWSNDHAIHHESTKQYGNSLSLDNEGSLSIQTSLDMRNCTGSPPWECSPPRLPCNGNIRQAGQANGALHIQVITNMSPSSDSKQSVCTPPRVPSSDDFAGQTPKKYNENIYEETKYDQYDQNHAVDKFVVPKFKLKGSFHQGDKRFGMNAGKQCVSNCYTAVIYSKLKNVRDWRTSHINDILVQGNLSYNSYHGSKDFLLVSEMPTSIELFNSSFFVNFGDSINAIDSEIDAGFPFALPLNIGIENALIGADGCFVSVNGYTSLVIKQGFRLFYFDSHSRDMQGKLCENGSSIVIELTDICHLYHILKEFVKNDPQSLFEITSVNVTISATDKDKSNTKKTYNDDNTHVVKNKDLEILGSYLCSNFNYIPVGYITKQKLCSKFKISHQNVKETAAISITFNMGKPVKLKSIISDGNCLFRALSFAISQRQEHHIKIRKKIVDHILHISKDLSSFVRDPYENAEEYVRMRKMKESNTWGTELEILAAAHFMQADIYTFTNNKWIKYSAHQIDKDINVENEAVYLKHVEESSHYEVVLSVEGSREYDLLEKSKNNKGIYVDFDKWQNNICTDHEIKKSNKLSNEIFEIVERTDITDLTKKRRKEVEVNISNENAKYQRMTRIDGNRVIEDKDLEMLHPAVNSSLDYIPLGYKTKRKLCSKFKISHKNIKETSGVNEKFNLGKPVNSKSIMSDGNNLFRALSFAISQRQEYHIQIRKKIVDHILHISKDIAFFVPDPYENAEEYVRMRKMKEPKTMGTELDILAAAHFMQADIYTFTNNKWIKYSAHQIDKDVNVENEAIYLHHVDKSSHYAVVMNVEENRVHNLPEKSKTIKDCTSVKCNFDHLSRNYCTDSKNNNTLLNETQVNLTDIRRKRRRELEKMRYCQNDTVRDKKRRSCKETYWNNAIYRSLKICKGSMKYINDETYRQDLIKKGKMKYIHDLDYRLRMKKKGKLKYEVDEEYRDNLIEKGKRKYEDNETYRSNMIKKGKQKYEEDETYRTNMIEKRKKEYEEDEAYRNNKIVMGKKKYKEDETYRANMIEKRKKEYEEDETYRNNKIVMGKKKYKEDETYRANMIEKRKKEYEEDETYRNKKIEKGKQKYEEDETYRNKRIENGKKKYEEDEIYRNNMIEKVKEKRLLFKVAKSDIDVVVQKFKDAIKKGPDYVCACCLRLLFQNQVLECKCENYDKQLIQKCVTEKYVHKCSSECELNCLLAVSCRNKLWICYTCHRKLHKGLTPPESFCNNLQLEAVPDELCNLNKLESHLIALNIPFQKIMNLPKGNQAGIIGPVVLVPSDVKVVTNTLPRPVDDHLLVKVKLKRKLEYKGYVQYEFVDIKHVEKAFNYLRNHNKWYANIELNSQWMDTNNEQKDSTDVVNDSANDSNNVSDKTTDTNAEESYLNESLRGIQLDTCLQPADIGQEVLDCYFDEEFDVAPAEGNNPIRVLKEEGIESKTFPCHYPSGKNTLTDQRDLKLSASRYFNLRLLSVENRFARDTSYVFFCQYLSELEKVMSNVQISLRKDFSKTGTGKTVTSDMICRGEGLKQLFKSDEGIKFLKPIRGTPPFWQKTQKDVLAMIRQIGIPAFFCSFSSADLRWSEIVESIMLQQGIAVNVDELSWDEKCKILRSNPVTAARMFDHRFHLFLKTVIMSDAHPIGKVKDYFYRVEFQQRGSPHTHCLFWIEDAPLFEKDEDQKVIDFVDKYITCSIPSVDVDPELHKIVNAVQQHSKHHSKSCKKKGTNCRFNFPRPPSVHSFISRPTTDKDLTESDIKVYKDKLETVWKEIKDSELDDISTEKLFEKAGLSQKEFEKCFQYVTSRNTIVLKRKKTECFTNQYNAHLLRAWDANMDIQFVLDVFSCVVYIISYISKSERELGMLLQQTKCEAADGNLSAQQTMKKVGSAYLHHREISAQEAVFRVTGLRMKECSRKVEFIPVGDNPCRLSIPLQRLKKKVESKSKQQQHDGDEVENHSVEETLWMRNKNDIYKAKPDIDLFNEMCLADFCSKFNVLTESQVPKKINKDTTFKLKNDFGYIRKLTRTSSGIIRYPRFSVDKVPEKYYQSILQLFLPFRSDDQLKPSMFETYEDFYKRGHVKFFNSNSLSAVKDTVDHNMSSYVKTPSSIDEAIKKLEENGSHEDAWAQLCSESESERVMCGIEGSENGNVNDDDGIIENNVPDLNREAEKEYSLPIRSTVFSNREIIPMLRSMNENQKHIFFDIRHWCLEKSNGKHVDPFYVFITGGAGTGKSRLIKCLYFEISRILAPTLCNPDDVSVLLTAPTGTAAFNINGMTIHSCLSIFKSLSKDHATLSEDKLNTLRSKLDTLQVLIIDEISMVNKRLLYFVHERLRQIKKKPESCLFGGVSIIAVGDFYQLPPVKSKKSDKLYVNDPSNPLNYLWNELFKVAELHEIMRQKDDKTFAEMLNRLRIKKKNQIIELDDFTLLKHCMKEAPDRILHIFATNAEVQQFNNSMIMKYFSDPVLLEAEDYEKDKTTGTLKRKSSFYNSSDIQLPSSILLAVGARIMLIRNQDIKDGLVNGVMGTVQNIITACNHLPEIIYIQFDDDNVGKSAKEQKIISGKRCVGLVRCSEDLSFASGVRKQYPLKLAFACTAHKVQGLTVSEVAVDLSKCFTFGQSYVALSRVTSNKGLFISEMNNESLSTKIYADPDIEAGLASMELFSMRTASAPVVNILKEHQMTIAYHNIQGLVPHISDLKVNSDMIRADFICLTETWLTSNDQNVKLDNYGFCHVCRIDAFNDDNEMFRTIKQMKNGGVGYFSKNGINFEHIHFDVRNIESIGFRIIETDTVVVTVYRTQKYNVKTFVKQFGLVLKKVNSISDKSVIVGDFNQDILKEERSIENFMNSNGYVQVITEPTTEKGTLIDHVYVKGVNSCCVRIVPTFYSYHEAVEINTGNA